MALLLLSVASLKEENPRSSSSLVFAEGRYKEIGGKTPPPAQGRHTHEESERNDLRGSSSRGQRRANSRGRTSHSQQEQQQQSQHFRTRDGLQRPIKEEKAMPTPPRPPSSANAAPKLQNHQWHRQRELRAGKNANSSSPRTSPYSSPMPDIRRYHTPPRGSSSSKREGGNGRQGVVDHEPSISPATQELRADVNLPEDLQERLIREKSTDRKPNEARHKWWLLPGGSSSVHHPRTHDSSRKTTMTAAAAALRQGQQQEKEGEQTYGSSPLSYSAKDKTSIL